MNNLSRFQLLSIASGFKARLLIPILMLLLFVTTMIWLPWQAQRMETNERQEQLIADTLWLEQAIHFQFDRNEATLRTIGKDIALKQLSSANAKERFLQIIKSNSEIHRIDWLDAQEKLISSTAESPLPTNNLSVFGHKKWNNAATLCLTPVTEVNSKDSHILSCHIPLFNENIFTGSIVITYRLQTVLEEMAPWWFAQENQISLLNTDEKVLANRSAGGQGRNVYTHNSTLDLPGLTLTIRTNSNKSEPKLLSNLLVLSVVLLSMGLIWSLIALWRDINRRLAAEGALQAQVAFRAAMENSLITGLRARDMQGRLTYVNPAFCKMIGHPAEEIVGKVPPMPYWAAEAFEEYQERFSQLLSGSVPSEGFETIYQRANGERFPVLIYESALVDEQGKQTGWMSSILDISELKHAQELTQQQQEKLNASARLATMGEIASMLAHELNQPLAAISSYTAGAINMINSGNVELKLLQEALEKTGNQAQRAGQIIRSVHEFVKKREACREALHLSSIFTSIMPLVELQAQASHINVQYQIEQGLPQISADKVLLEQVLLNLTRNATEAMAACPSQQRVLKIAAYYDHSNDMIGNVTIEVIDRGHGISPDIANQLFSPFFSTKISGMGMGLSICRTAIEFHGGSLTHHNNPNGGAIFRFTLPALPPQTHSIS
jgi:two-component system sensor histidine kinase DctS